MSEASVTDPSRAQARRSPGRLRAETSTYLDLVRLFAVALVFFSHAKRPAFGGGSDVLSTAGQYGEAGVALFFIISGLVIGHVFATRERTLGDYAVARLSRLWSVAIPAILITVVADVAGRALDPGLFDAAGVPDWQWDLRSVWQAVSPALFLNKLPGLDVEVGTNGPFWSLCYEAWYYVGFGCVALLRAPLWTRAALLLVIGVAVGPGVLSLAPIWIAGNLAYRALGRFGPSPGAWLAWVATTAAMPIGLLGQFHVAHWLQAGPLGLGDDSAFVVSRIYVPAVLLLANLLAFDAVSSRFGAALRPMAGLVRVLVDRSFSVYLYQAPLLFFFAALCRRVMAPGPGFVVTVAASLGTIVLLAEVTERRRKTVARWLRLAAVPFRRSVSRVRA